MIAREKAPRFLNLLVIKLPVTGVASIVHRVSGVLLFLAIPLFSWGFGLSLESSAGFEKLLTALDSLPFRLFLTLVIWSLSQHLFTGIRHLLLDIGAGVERRPARASAWAANLAALGVSLLYLASLL